MFTCKKKVSIIKFYFKICIAKKHLQQNTNIFYNSISFSIRFFCKKIFSNITYRNHLFSNVLPIQKHFLCICSSKVFFLFQYMVFVSNIQYKAKRTQWFVCRKLIQENLNV